MSAAALEGVLLHSGGARLLGRLYRAAGDGSQPAALLLHGIPGHELNLDLAIALREVGFDLLSFHYRGCWGSRGTYRIEHLLPDAAAALDWLCASPQRDPERVTVIGMSLGGWVALALAAQDQRVRAVVALSPLIDPRRTPIDETLAAEWAQSLADVSAQEIVRGWNALTPIPALAPALEGRPILLVSGDRDELFPPEHFLPLVDALPGVEWVRFPTADHVFSDVRSGLRHTVRCWLVSQIRV